MAEWVRVASVDEVPEGAPVPAEAKGERIVLVRADGTIYALEDQCSHQAYPLSDGEVDGTQLECIYHGARFDLQTGRATQLPAIKPVKTYDVDIRDDDVFVEVE